VSLYAPNGRVVDSPFYAAKLVWYERLRRWLGETAQPTDALVLGGDFNDVWGTLGRKLLAPAGFRGTTTAAATFPAYAPIRALDAIYVRGAVRLLQVERSRFALARQASDHLPLVAEVQLHPRPESSASS